MLYQAAPGLNAAGKWIYTNGRTDEWAAVHNPYADTSKGQKEFDWFHSVRTVP